MFDMTTYLLTKDDPGGPTFIPEEFTPHNQITMRLNSHGDDGALTRGRAIGGIISIALLVGTGACLLFGH